MLLKNDIVTGNYYNKYQTKNPIARYLMDGFFNAITELVVGLDVKSVHEVGCGEGHLTSFLRRILPGTNIRGSDFSSDVITLAENLNEDIIFKVQSIYDLEPKFDTAELVVCCEVLEHLEYPLEALKILQQISAKYCLLSVPREPIWRVLNMCRGKYVRDLGNTPGHIQHWSKRSFLGLIDSHFDIVKVKKPFPWTVVLCSVKEGFSNE